MKLFLMTNAVLYIVLGVWCALKPHYTSEAVGFTIKNHQGMAEYIAVYGGLEFAMGIFFLIAARSPQLQSAGMLFGALLYGGLVLFRTFAIITHSSDIQNGWNFFALEVALLTWALVILYPRMHSVE